MFKSQMLGAVSLFAGLATSCSSAYANVLKIPGKSIQEMASQDIVKVHSARRAHDALHDYGYNRVVYLSQHQNRYGKPIYRFRACKRGKKFRIKVNWYGEILRRKRAGFCDRDYY